MRSVPYGTGAAGLRTPQPQPGRDPIAQVAAELFAAQRNSEAQAWDPIAHNSSSGALKAAAQFSDL